MAVNSSLQPGADPNTRLNKIEQWITVHENSNIHNPPEGFHEYLYDSSGLLINWIVWITDKKNQRVYEEKYNYIYGTENVRSKEEIYYKGNKVYQRWSYDYTYDGSGNMISKAAKRSYYDSV